MSSSAPGGTGSSGDAEGALEPSGLGSGGLGGLGPGGLARSGFDDPEAAAARLAELRTLGADPEPWLPALRRAADPGQALAGLTELALAVGADRAALFGALDDDEPFRRRLTAVLGASDALARHLARHPGDWRGSTTQAAPLEAYGMQTQLLRAVGADPADLVPRTPDGSAARLDALRVAYRRILLPLAAADLAGEAGFEDTAAALADLAGAALEAALAIARARVAETAGEEAGGVRLAIIAMGKTGGRELNYASDVDVLVVADDESDLPAATSLAQQVIRICSDPTGEGALWPVDAALRPEGRAGPLVRTLASYLAYYHAWAKTWEFQALLKARPVAGDRGLGAQFVAGVAPMVWNAAEREGFVEDVQAMRRRVVDHIPAAQLDRELKLGPGGLRDVEFAVQLLQLVHGRADESLRSPSTLQALHALTAGGYVGRQDGAELATAYRFLRTVEHHIQLTRLRRTHLMPTAEPELRALGRSLGLTREPVAELTTAWRRHAREVRRLHEKLFYRPLLAAVARIPGDDVRLTPEAARHRLAALGYAEPAAALRHLEALTAGVSRRAAIQRTLLPAMLEWFADAPDPDAGLLAFRRISDDLGATPWYLRLLRDEGVTAERLARLLASSRYVVELIRRAPETIAILGDENALQPRDRPALAAEMRAAAARRDDPAGAVAAVRAVRRRELFRIAAADVLGTLAPEGVATALSELAVTTVAAALAAVERPAEVSLAVIGMGRLGGFELGYASDADVLVVHRPAPGVPDETAARAATAVVAELRKLLAAPAPDPPLTVDIGLRPEGKNGPVVRTLESYASYYARWSQPWEAQALLRAVPIAGDEELRDGFVALIDPLRYPAGGLSEHDVREIRRIKARVDAERLPRGADPSTHAKLGRGGLADVEWTTQLLQLRYAHRVPELRTTRTVEALRAARDAGLLTSDDAQVLVEAWRFATRARNATMLVRARPSDTLPHDTRDLAAVAQLLGYAGQETGRFVEDYRRATRRAHAVVERVFWS